MKDYPWIHVIVIKGEVKGAFYQQQDASSFIKEHFPWVVNPNTYIHRVRCG